MSTSAADCSDVPQPMHIRWGAARSVGTFLLQGPRAILWPDDPDGSKEWLECNLRLKRSQIGEGVYEFRQVYDVPNMLKHYARPAVLLRTAEWQTGPDHAAQRRGCLSSLSLTVQHFVLERSQVLRLNGQVQQFDAILDLLRLEEKGLYPSPEAPAPDATGTQQVASVRLDVAMLRRTREQRIEAAWVVAANPTELDRGLLQMWEDLEDLKANSQPASGFIERFELPPLNYVDLHSTDRELLWSEIRDCPEFDELWA